jgi:hypothetical protein
VGERLRGRPAGAGSKEMRGQSPRASPAGGFGPRRSRHVCAFFLRKEKEYRYDGALCCIYDLTRFGANIVMNSLRTHSMLIIGGVLQENPFFVPADEILRELRERTG